MTKLAFTKIKMLRLLNAFFLLFWVTNISFAQTQTVLNNYDALSLEERTERSIKAINDLKDGVLVVRLKTGSNKIQTLQRVANSPDISEKERLRLESMMLNEAENISKENTWLHNAFTEKYNFSEVLYFFDTSSVLLKNGVQSGYFLNEKLEVDPSVSLNNRPFLVAFYGASSSAYKSSQEGLVVLDEHFIELSEPFPHYTDVSSFWKIFIDTAAEKKSILGTVKSFDKRLTFFYKRRVDSSFSTKQ
jgi:hypothetical protein